MPLKHKALLCEKDFSKQHMHVVSNYGPCSGSKFLVAHLEDSKHGDHGGNETTSGLDHRCTAGVAGNRAGSSGGG